MEKDGRELFSVYNKKSELPNSVGKSVESKVNFVLL